MNQDWEYYAEEFEDVNSKIIKKSKKPKLSYKEGKKLKEAKKNGIKYPKKRKR